MEIWKSPQCEKSPSLVTLIAIGTTQYSITNQKYRRRRTIASFVYHFVCQPKSLDNSRGLTQKMRDIAHAIVLIGNGNPHHYNEIQALDKNLNLPVPINNWDYFESFTDGLEEDGHQPTQQH